MELGVRGGGKNLGYKPRYKEVLPPAPMDHYQDLRTEMVLNLQKVGIDVEVHHHEVGTAGQAEIDIRYDTLLKTADNVMKYKYVVKNTARQAGKTVTFMPKPIFMDNGSGMHTHQSLWKEGETSSGTRSATRGCRTPPGGTSAGCSSTPRRSWRSPPRPRTRTAAGAGLRGSHQPRLLAAEPVGLRADPRVLQDPAAKRVEFPHPIPRATRIWRSPRCSLAGLDGIKNKIEPPDPIDKDLYDLPPEEAAQVKQVPGSLEEVLDALEIDHGFLLEGGVFTQDVIDTWIEYKRENGLDAVRLRPHPYEFYLYYDV